jgi:hypothetical protein
MYVVEVETSTHDLLKDGVLAMPRGLTGSRYRGEVANEAAITRATLLGAPDYTTVVVSPQEAPGGDWEAILIACQMAACTSGGMPTAARLISWPTPELEDLTMITAASLAALRHKDHDYAAQEATELLVTLLEEDADAVGSGGRLTKGERIAALAAVAQTRATLLLAENTEAVADQTATLAEKTGDVADAATDISTEVTSELEQLRFTIDPPASPSRLSVFFNWLRSN